jgi:hypothetical protein
LGRSARLHRSPTPHTVFRVRSAQRSRSPSSTPNTRRSVPPAPDTRRRCSLRTEPSSISRARARGRPLPAVRDRDAPEPAGCERRAASRITRTAVHGRIDRTQSRTHRRRPGPTRARRCRALEHAPPPPETSDLRGARRRHKIPAADDIALLAVRTVERTRSSSSRYLRRTRATAPSSLSEKQSPTPWITAARGIPPDRQARSGGTRRRDRL